MYLQRTQDVNGGPQTQTSSTVHPTTDVTDGSTSETTTETPLVNAAETPPEQRVRRKLPLTKQLSDEKPKHLPRETNNPPVATRESDQTETISLSTTNEDNLTDDSQLTTSTPIEKEPPSIDDTPAENESESINTTTALSEEGENNADEENVIVRWLLFSLSNYDLFGWLEVLVSIFVSFYDAFRFIARCLYFI